MYRIVVWLWILDSFTFKEAAAAVGAGAGMSGKVVVIHGVRPRQSTGVNGMIHDSP